MQHLNVPNVKTAHVGPVNPSLTDSTAITASAESQPSNGSKDMAPLAQSRRYSATVRGGGNRPRRTQFQQRGNSHPQNVVTRAAAMLRNTDLSLKCHRNNEVQVNTSPLHEGVMTPQPGSKRLRKRKPKLAHRHPRSPHDIEMISVENSSLRQRVQDMEAYGVKQEETIQRLRSEIALRDRHVCPVNMVEPERLNPSELDLRCEAICYDLIVRLGLMPLAPSADLARNHCTSDLVQLEEEFDRLVASLGGGEGPEPERERRGSPEPMDEATTGVPGEAVQHPRECVGGGAAPPVDEPEDMIVEEQAIEGADDAEPDWLALVAEFEQWIYMKTQCMKRDKAFLQVLPGLMQRWLKHKKIEVYPLDFTDCLMSAAIARLSPSVVEQTVSTTLADPDTRCMINSLNSALSGEVKIFNNQQVDDWVQDRAERWWLDWITAPFGWNPSISIRIPQPKWTVALACWLFWLVWHYFCIYWYGEQIEVDYNVFVCPLSGLHIRYSWYGLLEWGLVTFERYTLYGILRRMWFRLKFHEADFTSVGFYRAPEGLKVFQQGAVKSQ